MIDWRKRFSYPRPDAIWCAECLRFETGAGRFKRVAKLYSARVLETLARIVRWPGDKLAGWITDGAETCQVHANIQNGVFDVVQEEP